MGLKKIFNTLLNQLKFRKPKKLEPVPLPVKNAGESLVSGHFCLNDKLVMLKRDDYWELFYIEMDEDEERLI
jgi:hypothetical protein